MTDKSQKQFVENELNLKGEITRNTCLKNYISRLSGLIHTLKKDGWEFSSFYRKTQYGKDFVYKVTKSPTVSKGSEIDWERNNPLQVRDDEDNGESY